MGVKRYGLFLKMLVEQVENSEDTGIKKLHVNKFDGVAKF